MNFESDFKNHGRNWVQY